MWQFCISRKTLQNEYLDAKIGVDTAENEPRIASLAVVAMDPSEAAARRAGDGPRVEK